MFFHVDGSMADRTIVCNFVGKLHKMDYNFLSDSYPENIFILHDRFLHHAVSATAFLCP